MAEENENQGTEGEPKRTEVTEGAQLSQSDVDRIVESRLARERKKFQGHDEYKEKAEKYDQLEAEKKSEIERATTQAQEAAARAERLEQENRDVKRRAAILQEVAKPDRKIVDPEAAVEFLLGADSDLVKFDDDGVPTNIDEAVEGLTTKRSYLVSAETQRVEDADQGARGGAGNQLSEADLKTMTAQDIVKAREEGRLDNLLAGK